MHKVTPRTVGIVEELQRLVGRAEDHLPHASHAACAEWRTFRSALPSEHELRQGSVAMSDDVLEMMVGKIQRFYDILHGNAGRPSAPTGSATPLREAALGSNVRDRAA